MAEIKTMIVLGQETLRFVEFVRMHSQNVLHFLGRAPGSAAGAKPPVSLPLARVLIDQLAAVAVKTRGNLTLEEDEVINNALKTLKEAYDEVALAEKSRLPSTPPAV